MTPDQKQHWDLLREIDEDGHGLDTYEIDFVANLIDNEEGVKGFLSPNQMRFIRDLHERTVDRNYEGDDNDD